MKHKFVLTRDMVPVHYIEDRDRSLPRYTTGFVCPLPLGYEQVVQDNIARIHLHLGEIVKEILVLARKQEHPFANILIEYPEKSEAEKRKFIDMFFNLWVYWDKRGMYGANAGNMRTSQGDIYLTPSASCYYDFAPLDGFRRFLTPQHAFHCHNVDLYWEALLTRELCVRYFNLLNSIDDTGGRK